MKKIISMANSINEISEICGKEAQWAIRLNERIKKIDSYLEDDKTIWFAVYDKTGLYLRVNSRFVETVMYKEFEK